MVVLKPLSRALADGDPIYAVIRGGAVNQDGRTNGLTAPSRQAQEAVLRAAYRHAGIAPGQVDYVEAHGTGTPLGDPIELAALGAVLAEGRDAGRPLHPRLGEDEHRPPRGRGRDRRADQGGAGPAPPGDPGEPPLLPPESPRRPRRPAAPDRRAASNPGPTRAGRHARASARSASGARMRTSSSRRPRAGPHPAMRRDPRGRDDEDVVIPLSARDRRTPWRTSAASFRDFLSDAPDELDLRDVAYSAGARRAISSTGWRSSSPGATRPSGPSTPSCGASRMYPS